MACECKKVPHPWVRPFFDFTSNKKNYIKNVDSSPVLQRKLQSNLGLRTCRNLNNSVSSRNFELKMTRYSNKNSVLEQLFCSPAYNLQYIYCYVALLLLVLYCYVYNIHCYAVDLQFYCTKHSFLFISPKSWIQ